MIKITALLVRIPELTHEQFMRHWVDVHAPLVDALPGVRRYVQSHILDGFSPPHIPRVSASLDGIAELWFDDRAAFEMAFASDEGQRLAADGALFIGQISFFVIEEKVMIP